MTDCIFNYQKEGLEKYKRRRKTKLGGNWIGRKANKESLRRYCVEIWSDLVRSLNNHKCFMCGSAEYIHAHHLITKKWTKTAFDTNNGVPLCKNCHTLGIESAHLSSWFLEEKLKVTKINQYNWFLKNRSFVSIGAVQEKPNYQLILASLLEEFERVSPTVIKRSGYFKFSEQEEKQIITDAEDINFPYEDIAKKWKCGINSVYSIIKRHNIKIKQKVYRERRPDAKTFSIPIIKIDKNGETLQEYESIVKASIENNILGSSINNCLSGRSRTSGGYKWAYKKTNCEKNITEAVSENKI